MTFYLTIKSTNHMRSLNPLLIRIGEAGRTFLFAPRHLCDSLYIGPLDIRHNLPTEKERQRRVTVGKRGLQTSNIYDDAAVHAQLKKAHTAIAPRSKRS